MSEEVYRSGSQNKQQSPSEIKKMIKKMKKSYAKWEVIKQYADVQHSIDEKVATNELEQNLELIDRSLPQTDRSK